MLQVVHRVITRHLLGQAGGNVEGADEADSGAVTLIQRFGSAANLHILELTRFDGHLILNEEGVRYAQVQSAVPGGVSRADG